MSRELRRELLETQQQIAEEQHRRLVLFTEVIINIFVEIGGRWTIEDIKLHLRNGGDQCDEADRELELILDNLVAAGFIQCTDNGIYFA